MGEKISKELQDRMDAFNKKLKPLLGEFKLGLASELVFEKHAISSKPILVDMEEKKEPKAEITEE